MRFLEKLVYTHFGVSDRSQKLRASARKGTEYALCGGDAIGVYLQAALRSVSCRAGSSGGSLMFAVNRL